MKSNKNGNNQVSGNINNSNLQNNANQNFGVVGNGQGNTMNQNNGTNQQVGQNITDTLAGLNNPTINNSGYQESTLENSRNVTPMQFTQPMTDIQNQQAMQSGKGQIPNQVSVVAVRRDGSEISQYKLSDGRVVGKDEIFDLVVSGELTNVIAANSSTGEPYIRSYPDGDPSNNLQNLPSF